MELTLALYQIGAGQGLPGLRVSVARHAPRGVSKERLSRDGYYDVAIPLLAPSVDLVRAYRCGELTFTRFSRAYRKEMKNPASRQAMRLLAAVAQTQRVNLGCFCVDEACCHRSVLRDLINAEAANLPPRSLPGVDGGTEPCSLPEIED